MRKKMWKSVKIWQNYGRDFVVSLFWPSHVGKMPKNLVKIGYEVSEICSRTDGQTDRHGYHSTPLPYLGRSRLVWFKKTLTPELWFKNFPNVDWELSTNQYWCSYLHLAVKCNSIISTATFTPNNKYSPFHLVSLDVVGPPSRWPLQTTVDITAQHDGPLRWPLNVGPCVLTTREAQKLITSLWWAS